MCDSLSHSKHNLTTSQWLFFSVTDKLLFTNDDDDAQNLYRNKSLILILHDDDGNQIIQVEIICVLSIF